jgi:hypothetical protein
VEHIERTRYLDAVYWTMSCHDRGTKRNGGYLNGRWGVSEADSSRGTEKGEEDVREEREMRSVKVAGRVLHMSRRLRQTVTNNIHARYPVHPTPPPLPAVAAAAAEMSPACSSATVALMQ